MEQNGNNYGSGTAEAVRGVQLILSGNISPHV